MRESHSPPPSYYNTSEDLTKVRACDCLCLHAFFACSPLFAGCGA